MMIVPTTLRERYEQLSYLDMMKERDRLVSWMQQFETNEMAGDRSDPEWQYRPGPDVRYLAELENLMMLSGIMYKKYSEEYVYGYKSLHRDVIEYGETISGWRK